LVHREHRVQLVPVARSEELECQESREEQVRLGHRVLLELRVRMEQSVFRVLQGLLDRRVHRVHREYRVHREPREPTETLVLLGLQELQEMLGRRDWRELQELLGLLAMQVRPDFRVPPVLLERQALPDLKALKVLKDLAGHREIQVHPGSLEERASLVQSDCQAVLDPLDPVGQLVRAEPLDPVGLQARLDQLDLLEHQAVPVLMALPGRLVTRGQVDQRELQAVLDSLAHKELLEIPDHQELQVILVIKGHLDQMELSVQVEIVGHRAL